MEYPRFVFGPNHQLVLVRSSEEHQAQLDAGLSDDSAVILVKEPKPKAAKQLLPEAPKTEPLVIKMEPVAPEKAPQLLADGELTRKQLLEKARALKLQIPHNASKQQLIDLLKV